MRGDTFFVFAGIEFIEEKELALPLFCYPFLVSSRLVWSGLVWFGLFTLECFTFGNRLSVCCRS